MFAEFIKTIESNQQLVTDMATKLTSTSVEFTKTLTDVNTRFAEGLAAQAVLRGAAGGAAEAGVAARAPALGPSLARRPGVGALAAIGQGPVRQGGIGQGGVHQGAVRSVGRVGSGAGIADGHAGGPAGQGQQAAERESGRPGRHEQSLPLASLERAWPRAVEKSAWVLNASSLACSPHWIPGLDHRFGQPPSMHHAPRRGAARGGTCGFG